MEEAGDTPRSPALKKMRRLEGEQPVFDHMSEAEESKEPTGVAISGSIPAPEWAPVIDRVKSAIVAIRVTGVRPFEDSPAGVWQGTGFVVCLADPEHALILTNRHIISTGPIRAFATFDEHEELPIFPVYRDPIHDFGLFQFDSTKLRFTPSRQIALVPENLRVGTEVLVIGNDNAEKIQILPATIARVDRNAPTYCDSNYQDENTFYAGAGSNTSGGSSGSPVIDRSGSCIAVNAGGATEAASAYYLPLDRVVYVLGWLQANPDKAPTPPRGTLLTKFLFQPFDMLLKLGFTQEQERELLASSVHDGSVKAKPGLAPRGRPKGLLVVHSFLPGTEAEQKLRPGDVLLRINGKGCLTFASLEDRLDSFVGKEVTLSLSRAGTEMEVVMTVTDLYPLISHDIAECAGGVFTQVSYHTCKRYHLSTLDRGIFVVESGFGFGLELPYSAIVTGVQGQKVASLQAFQQALSSVPDGGAFEVAWFNPMTNERRTKRSSVRMERSLWPICTWRFAAERPNSWVREAAPAALSNDSSKIVKDGNVVPGEAVNASRDQLPEHVPSESAESSNGSDKNAAADEDADMDSHASGSKDTHRFPTTRDATVTRVQPMLCTVTTRVAHEFATDFIMSEDELSTTIVRRFGVGVVVDAVRGLVITDRYVVPQPLAQVELTFAQIVTTDALVLFVHPQHNVVVLKYDVNAVQPLPVQSLDVGLTSDGQGSSYEEPESGEVLHYVALHPDHRLSAKQTTVGSIYLKAWAFVEPSYRERNMEICNLNDSLQGLGGLLVEPGANGRTRAWFAQFPCGKKHYLAGIPIQVLVGLLHPIGLFGGASLPVPLHLAKVAALDCEFEELALAKARRYHGMTMEQAPGCCESRRQVLMLSRVTTGGTFDGKLAEGDVLLKVASKGVTRPQEVEQLMNEHSPNGEPVWWKVLRSREEKDFQVSASVRPSDGTARILVFLGIVMRPTPRAVSERGGPVRPHAQPGQGLYFWHIFDGSPADTFGLRPPGWLVQVDDQPTDSIDTLLEIIHSGKLKGRSWLRCCTTDAEGRETVRALQPDPDFWPTVELCRCFDDDGPKPRWARSEHPDPL
mmetsp:Transcript_92212/g.192818  ORF Transcript_92212/g.192818 Transcript_92212/m.192818 type:complete len:1083 (+) Transcript_92212:50-3298(+)